MVESLNNFSGAFLNYLQATTIQNSIFVLALLALLFFLRNRDARLLNLIAIVGMIKLILPPIFSVRVPILSGPESGLLDHALLKTQLVEETFQITGTSVLFLSWLAIAAFLFSYPLIKAYLMKRRFSGVRPISVKSLLTDRGTETPAFLQSNESHSPVVLGFFKHWVVLPKDWDDWTEECQRAILAHELAHIRNRDHWVSFLQLVVKSIYFFNPLVFILDNLLSHYREMACDDAAVAEVQVSRLAYSKYLMNVTEQILRTKPRPTPLSSFSQPRISVKQRVKYQLTPHKTAADAARKSGRILIVIFALSVLPVSPKFTTPVQAVALQLADQDGKNCTVYDEDGNLISTAIELLPAKARLVTTSAITVKPLNFTPIEIPLND